MDICDFCGKEALTANGNAFHGCYCEECLKLEIEQAKECLVEIKGIKKIKKKAPEKNVDALRTEAEAALFKLTGQHIKLD